MPLEVAKAGEDVRKLWRKLNAAIAEVERQQRRIYALEHPNIRRFDLSGSGRGAAPFTLYDKAESYSPGQDVVVIPTHELVTTGLLDEETEDVIKAPAGMYRCQRAVAPVPIDPEDLGAGYRYNAPKWPTETADNPEATSTYWWLIALYPKTVTICEDGAETEFYSNTQDIPEQP